MPEAQPSDLVRRDIRPIDEDAIDHESLPMKHDILTLNPRPAGNRSKFTQQRLDHICEALRVGNSRDASARMAGITGSTLHGWMDASDDVTERVAEAEAEAERMMLGTIQHAAQAGTWQAAAWWLERRRYSTWGRKDKQDIEGLIRSLGPTLGLNDEEIEAAIADAKRVMLGSGHARD